MRRRWVVLVAVVSVVLVTSAVVLVVRAGRDGAGSAAAAVPRFDPPTAFDAGSATSLPREADGAPPPAVLRGFDAFVALPGRLQVIDTRTGAVRAEHAPEASVEGGPAPRAPVVLTVAGRTVVVAVFVVTVPGHGTTLGHDAVEILALDAETFTRVPAARIDLPPTLSGEQRLRAAWPVGGGDGPLVVSTEIGPDRAPVSHAVELPAGRELWRAPDWAAAVVVGGDVIGVQRGTGGAQVRALRRGDGGQVWTAPVQDDAVTVWPAGRALVAASSVALGTGARTLTLHDAGTGRVVLRRAVPGAVTCRFDDAVTTVCWNAQASQAWAAGFDASTGRTLWELPDAAAGRVAPRVSTVWHNAVYGTTDNGPVVLTASTGADRPGSPGIAPDLVNDVVGVVGATIDRPRPRAHRAIG